jgi:hypothetical protein
MKSRNHKIPLAALSTVLVIVSISALALAGAVGADHLVAIWMADDADNLLAQPRDPQPSDGYDDLEPMFIDDTLDS